jgi:hypothetical protein
MSDEFEPATALTPQELQMLCSLKAPVGGVNVNVAINQNDITMKT